MGSFQLPYGQGFLSLGCPLCTLGPALRTKTIPCKPTLTGTWATPTFGAIPFRLTGLYVR